MWRRRPSNPQILQSRLPSCLPQQGRRSHRWEALHYSCPFLFSKEALMCNPFFKLISTLFLNLIYQFNFNLISQFIFNQISQSNFNFLSLAFKPDFKSKLNLICDINHNSTFQLILNFSTFSLFLDFSTSTFSCKSSTRVDLFQVSLLRYQISAEFYSLFQVWWE